MQGLDFPTIDEPFVAVILCSAAREKVDKRTRSKWSRVMRYVAEYKTSAEPPAAFVRRKGGINKCASRFARRSVMDQELEVETIHLADVSRLNAAFQKHG
jgi:hypothetical protein